MTSDKLLEIKFDKSVMCVIVLYFPPENFINEFEKLIVQFGKLLIVDNTPGVSNFESVEQCSKYPNFQYLSLGSNMGIAHALNIAGEIAVSNGFSWLLTLDQDSVIPESYIDYMLKSLGSYQEPEMVGLLCPALSVTNASKIDLAEIECAITSGTLMRTSVFKKVGWFNEDLFIDYVDFDYCFRVGLAGMKILQIPGLRLKHTIGNPIQINTPLGALTTPNHPPIRRYYKFRNRIRMVERYFWCHPGWATKELLSGPLEVMKILAMEPDKVNKIKMILLGTWDGLRGRFGAAPESFTKNRGVAK